MGLTRRRFPATISGSEKSMFDLGLVGDPTSSMRIYVRTLKTE